MTTPFNELWERYYAPKLTGYELKQFIRAEAQPQTTFLTDIIQPSAYRPDLGTYMAVDTSVNTAGRGHYNVAEMTADDWWVQTYFTNVLRIATRTDPDFTKPKRRTALGPHYVVTFEFDTGNADFFKQQLGWLRTPKHKLDSPIGQFVSDVRSRYADFVGLNVTYSGNKSFHYHCVFATDLVAQRAPDPTSLRYGLEQAWDTLAAEFQAFGPLAIPASEQPDDSLRRPENYRRLPGGTRIISKPNHFFGVPEGLPVPQLTMWEHFFARSGAGSASLFDPSQFTRTDIITTSRKGSSAPVEFMRDFGERAYCADKMSAIYDGLNVWPRFEGFVHERGELRARFTNSPTDKHPASYMSEGFGSILLQGKTYLGFDKPPRLPKSLGEMLAIWSEEYRQRLLAPGGRERTQIEQDFADAATSKPAAMKAIAPVLDRLVRDDKPCHFLSAPEGISKSRSLIENVPAYHDLYDAEQRTSLIMFAFISYPLAQEKADEFNAKHAGGECRAIVLKSFSRLYSEFCAELKIAEITLERAGQMGFKSIIAAITDQQPEILDLFEAWHARLREEFADVLPVIFTVHDVAHDWIKNTLTRTMFAPAYWNRAIDDQTRRDWIRAQTELALLIHDEVSADNLTLTIPFEVLAWVRGLADEKHPDGGNKMLWPASASLPRLLEAFTTYAKVNPPPAPLTFEQAYEIRQVPLTAWDIVETVASHEYGERQDNNPDWIDIYAATAGQTWAIHTRPWPTTSAVKTLILTTEAVPTAVIRRIGQPWTVTELDTPDLPRDAVETHVSREVISRNLPGLVREAREAHVKETGRPLLGIGNKMAHLTDTRSHVGAKGSNEYMGQDIIQTMVQMPPEQYAVYEALNTWCGRSDLVRLRHLDEFNQTAGRNLGFRAPATGPMNAHILLISRRLFEALADVMTFARYEMRERMSVRTKKLAKSSAKSAFAQRPPLTSKERLAALRASLNARLDVS